MGNALDFGTGYLEFGPAVDGKTADGLISDGSKACLDGWFTSRQLRNIANELDRKENEMRDKGGDRT